MADRTDSVTRGAVWKLQCRWTAPETADIKMLSHELDPPLYTGGRFGRAFVFGPSVNRVQLCRLSDWVERMPE